MFFSLSIASAVRKPLRVEKAQGFGHEADVQRVGIKRLAVDVHDAFAVAADGERRAAFMANERRIIGVFSLLVFADDRCHLQKAHLFDQQQPSSSQKA